MPLFEEYDKTIRTILRARFSNSPFRMNYSDIKVALQAMTCLYAGVFVSCDIKSIDKTVYMVDPTNYHSDVVNRVKTLQGNYTLLDTALKFALKRDEELRKYGSEPKNKNLLPKNVGAFFYNDYIKDSYFLHLLYDRLYFGYLTKGASK